MELDQFVEQQYELATAVGQVVDAEDFINNIRGVMIDLEVTMHLARALPDYTCRVSDASQCDSGRASRYFFLLQVIRKPDDVIMCSEVPGRPAEVKCEQCKDFFSQAGSPMVCIGRGGSPPVV